ncbi:MAG: TolC family protein [Bacteroidales bacterium]
MYCSLLAAAAQPDSLNHYLQTAAENNPGVQAAFLAYQAALQRVPQAGAYDNPTLEMGVFLQPMDILGGKQVAQFQLMQMFPWFGVRKAAQTEARQRAKTAFEQFRAARDNVFLEVYTQWYVLCRLQQQLMNNRENKKLLEQLEQLALQKFASPNLTRGSEMSGVLRIRMEIAETDNNVENLLSAMQAEKAKFNALLNRSGNGDVCIPDSLKQIPFLFDSASVMAQISAQNPMLTMISEEEAAERAKAEADRKMSYPMFGIGLQYMLINKAPASAGTDGGMHSMNGRDMWMPMVSVGIPIYRSKYRAQQRESAFLQQASREKYIDARNMLEAELYSAKHLLDDAARRIALYRKQTELAQTAYNLIVQEFASGTSDLSDVIQVQRQLLDYELKMAEAVADYNTMVANIQKLMSSGEE